MSTTLMFMAAGFGTRFGGGVKQIEPVGPHGEVLMDYAVHDALKAGFDRVVFIIRRDIEEEFRSGVGRRTEARCAVEYVYQELTDLPAGFTCPAGRRKPWGTGQAVFACRNVIDGPFCVLNADDYYGAEAFRRIHDYITKKADPNKLDLCMAGYVLGNTLSASGAVTRGLCRMDDQGRLEAIRETRGIVLEDGTPCAPINGEMRRLDPRVPVSMNIWGMPAAFIDFLADGFESFLTRVSEDDMDTEYLIPVAVGEMIRSGRGSVRVLPTEDRWFGMTYAEDKRLTQTRISELIAEGAYPEKL